MSSRKGNTVGTVGALGLGALIGVGIAFFGSKLLSFLKGE